MSICIVGLGLIGGSLAMALEGFSEYEVIGIDIDDVTVNMARKRGINAVFSPESALRNAEVVVFCISPAAVLPFLRENINLLPNDVLITDVCGVKTKLSKEISEFLPAGMDYVGGHPMAGKEIGGFDNASKDLFQGAGFIVTPLPTSKTKNIDIVRRMAQHIGCSKVIINTPAQHDEIIAYTSDLMHISAVALCLEYNNAMKAGHTAGAFRDCTRIARIDPQLWTDLFFENKDNVLREIDRFVRNLSDIQHALQTDDAGKLTRLLTLARANKEEMQNR